MSDRTAVIELLELSEAIRTQDNCATSHPIFTVQQQRRIYGFDPAYTDDAVWIDQMNECREADAEERKRLDAEEDETGKEPHGWTRTGYRDQWEFVTACLTRKGAEDFIARQRHNLKDPRVYVESAYRNQEWIDLRAALSRLPESRPTPGSEPTTSERQLADAVIRRYEDAVRAEVKAVTKQDYSEAARQQIASQTLAFPVIVACRVVGRDVKTLEGDLEAPASVGAGTPPQEPTIRVGVCTGSLERPHKQAEWWGHYTVCLICKRGLSYMNIDEAERVMERQRPTDWPKGHLSLHAATLSKEPRR